MVVACMELTSFSRLICLGDGIQAVSLSGAAKHFQDERPQKWGWSLMFSLNFVGRGDKMTLGLSSILYICLMKIAFLKYYVFLSMMQPFISSKEKTQQNKLPKTELFLWRHLGGS